MSVKLMALLAKFIIRKFKVQDVDGLFETIFNVLSIACTAIEVVGIVLVGVWFTVILQLVLSVIFAMLFRMDGGEHYDTFPECFLTGLLINTLYATVCMFFIRPLWIQIVLAVALALFYRKKQ